MKITLCTSPHLDRSALFDGRSLRHRDKPLRIAQTFLPMGLLSLAAAVKDIAKVGIFDLNKELNAGTLSLSKDFYAGAAEAILTGEPDLIGFMTECDSFHHVIRICAIIKARRPQALIVLGCVHASYNAREILSRYHFVDFVVRGEGEVAFRQLVDALAAGGSLGGVGSLSYRSRDEVKSAAELPLIQDLDTLPWIDPELAGLHSGDALWVEIGRGCPFKCNFCVTAPYWHRRHRIKSPERIIAELRFFRDRYGRSDFNFTHDLFTTDRRWVLKFSAALHEADLGVSWTCSSRTDTLDEEQLAAMAKAGCRDIYFGVETGTAAMQTSIDKGLGLAASRQIIDLCHRYGVGTTIGFIAGLPGETHETLAGTLREAANYLRMSRTTVHLFGYCPYRGSSGFNAIQDDLVPEVQFVDFPVDRIVDVENRALINAHRDVFARYSRLSSHREQGFDEILEVAEEYFPILNSVPQVVTYFLEAGVDPYDQLRAWAAWLRGNRRLRPDNSYDAHLGTIDEFLAFAEEYAASLGLGDRLFQDMLKWERVKQEFRSEAPETELTAVTSLPDGGKKVRLNPTLRLEDFQHAQGGNAKRGGSLPATFAFVRRRDGEASIVRIGPLAQAIIEIAEDFDSADELRSALQAEARVNGALESSSAEAVRATVDQLISNDIMILNQI